MTRINKYSLQLVILLFILLNTLSPFRVQAYEFDMVSAGLKFTYATGKYGGFTWGFELSCIDFSNDGAYFGIAADIDFCKSRTKLHLGAEGQPGVLIPGVCAGPTLLFDKFGTELGFSVIPYFGLVLYPHINFSYFPESNRFYTELGTYLKWPVSIKNGLFNT